jgi:hypothetical protein
MCPVAVNVIEELVDRRLLIVSQVGPRILARIRGLLEYLRLVCVIRREVWKEWIVSYGRGLLSGFRLVRRGSLVVIIIGFVGSVGWSCSRRQCCRRGCRFRRVGCGLWSSVAAAVDCGDCDRIWVGIVC